jgi:hypothetical protein
VCGATSETIYRCDACGKDLVGEQDDRDELVTDGGTSTDSRAIAQIHDADRASVETLADRAVHPEELDGDLAYLLASTDFDECPYRHPDRLEAAWDHADSIAVLAEDLDSAPEVVGKWLHIWGIYERSERGSLAKRLRANGGAL